MADALGAIAPTSGKVYYTGNYWNDFPDVQTEINMRTTGDRDLVWFDHFFKHYPGPYKKVLMLNCGNGWVERELYKKGYINEVIGVDLTQDLLHEAREQAKRDSMPFTYYRMDINSARFKESGFDLVINHAAAHHIAKLNKVFCELLRIMSPSGIFLNYDYVGPHRNQYPIQQWHEATLLNKELPWQCRQVMTYPHLPTMLATDPSEAVHSELILETTKRYFDIELFRPIGGALAYPLLTHNKAIQAAPRSIVKKAVSIIMQADGEYLNKKPETTMFAYWVARPNKQALNNTDHIKSQQQEEDTREKIARTNNKIYYPLSLIQELYQELDDLRIAKTHKQTTIEELQAECDKLRQDIAQLKSRSLRGRLSRVAAHI